MHFITLGRVLRIGSVYSPLMLYKARPRLMVFAASLEWTDFNDIDVLTGIHVHAETDLTTRT